MRRLIGSIIAAAAVTGMSYGGLGGAGRPLGQASAHAIQERADELASQGGFDGFGLEACASSSDCVGGQYYYGEWSEYAFNPRRLRDPSGSRLAWKPGNAVVACVPGGVCYLSTASGSLVREGPDLHSPVKSLPTAREVTRVMKLFAGTDEVLACPSASQCSFVWHDMETTFDPDQPGRVRRAAIAPASYVCVAAKRACEHAPGHREPTYLESIACPSTTECTTTGERGDAITFNPQEPAKRSSVDVSPSTWETFGIACATSSRCVAEVPGRFEVFDPLTRSILFSAPASFGDYSSLPACTPGGGQCVYANRQGRAESLAVSFSVATGKVIGRTVVPTGQVQTIACPTENLCTTGQFTINPTR
jgi:hypothetical protein